MVSEASFSFGTTSRSPERVRSHVYVRPISSTTPAHALHLDVVAEPQRLRDRDQDAGDHVADRALAGEPDHEADDRRRGEHAAGDRAHLRDHEQRRHDADEDDRRRRRCGAGRGSASPPPAAGRGARCASRRTSRATDGGRRSPTAAISSVLPEVGHREHEPIRPSRSVSARRTPRRSGARTRRAPRRRASRARPPRPRRSAGKSSRPRSKSLTETPSSSSRSAQATAASASPASSAWAAFRSLAA